MFINSFDKTKFLIKRQQRVVTSFLDLNMLKLHEDESNPSKYRVFFDYVYLIHSTRTPIYRSQYDFGKWQIKTRIIMITF